MFERIGRTADNRHLKLEVERKGERRERMKKAEECHAQTTGKHILIGPWAQSLQHRSPAALAILMYVWSCEIKKDKQQSRSQVWHYSRALFVCVCQTKTKDRADSMSEKSVHSPRRASNLSTSGIRAHRASDYTTRAGTLHVSSNKHFRHSPTSSIVKHKHALQNTPTLSAGPWQPSGVAMSINNTKKKPWCHLKLFSITNSSGKHNDENTAATTCKRKVGCYPKEHRIQLSTLFAQKAAYIFIHVQSIQYYVMHYVCHACGGQTVKGGELQLQVFQCFQFWAKI